MRFKNFELTYLNGYYITEEYVTSENGNEYKTNKCTYAGLAFTLRETFPLADREDARKAFVEARNQYVIAESLKFLEKKAKDQLKKEQK